MLRDAPAPSSTRSATASSRRARSSRARAARGRPGGGREPRAALRGRRHRRQRGRLRRARSADARQAPLAAVPEPASAPLLGAGLAGLARCGRAAPRPERVRRRVPIPLPPPSPRPRRACGAPGLAVGRRAARRRLRIPAGSRSAPSGLVAGPADVRAHGSARWQRGRLSGGLDKARAERETRAASGLGAHRPCSPASTRTSATAASLPCADRGQRAHPHVITHLYHRGTILASEKTATPTSSTRGSRGGREGADGDAAQGGAARLGRATSTP